MKRARSGADCTLGLRHLLGLLYCRSLGTRCSTTSRTAAPHVGTRRRHAFLLFTRKQLFQEHGFKTEHCALGFGLGLEEFGLGLGLGQFLAVCSWSWCGTSQFSFKLKVSSSEINPHNDHQSSAGATYQAFNSRWPGFYGCWTPFYSVWNTLPEEITTSHSLPTFCQRLKIWFFRKSYPDIII